MDESEATVHIDQGSKRCIWGIRPRSNYHSWVLWPRIKEMYLRNQTQIKLSFLGTLAKDQRDVFKESDPDQTIILGYFGQGSKRCIWGIRPRSNYHSWVLWPRIKEMYLRNQTQIKLSFLGTLAKDQRDVYKESDPDQTIILGYFGQGSKRCI